MSAAVQGSRPHNPPVSKQDSAKCLENTEGLLSHGKIKDRKLKAAPSLSSVLPDRVLAESALEQKANRKGKSSWRQPIRSFFRPSTAYEGDRSPRTERRTFSWTRSHGKSPGLSGRRRHSGGDVRASPSLTTSLRFLTLNRSKASRVNSRGSFNVEQSECPFALGEFEKEILGSNYASRAAPKMSWAAVPGILPATGGLRRKPSSTDSSKRRPAVFEINPMLGGIGGDSRNSGDTVLHSTTAAPIVPETAAQRALRLYLELDSLKPLRGLAADNPFSHSRSAPASPLSDTSMHPATWSTAAMRRTVGVMASDIALDGEQGLMSTVHDSEADFDGAEFSFQEPADADSTLRDGSPRPKTPKFRTLVNSIRIFMVSTNKKPLPTVLSSTSSSKSDCSGK